MKFGMTLPQFADSSDEAVEAARRAEDAGLDGVFVFDHLWPMGQPGRPALSALPLLGAVAATTGRVAVGTLVARVGLLPDEVLVGELLSLAGIAPGRVIAGLGPGDGKSAPENRAAGVGFAPVGERLASLERCAGDLASGGVTVWIGGGSVRTAAVAHRLGVPLNLWDATVGEVGEAAVHGEVTWGGPLGASAHGGPTDLGTAARFVSDVDVAGATWVVWGWPRSPEEVASVAARLRSS